jgi:nicotinamidase-related amidase
MSKRIKGVAAMAVLAVAALAIGLNCSAVQAQDILQEWATIKPPPPPEIKAVAIDTKKTALMVMDFNQKSCTAAQRARCAAALPKVQKLLATVRAKGMIVVHTYTPNMQPSDLSKEVTPAAGERVLQTRGDKFQGSDLEKSLKDQGITTLLLVGTSGNGAVLFTAIRGSQLGFKIIVPIDAMPADAAYQEQFAIWEIGNAPTVREVSTLTKLDMLTF